MRNSAGKTDVKSRPGVRRAMSSDPSLESLLVSITKARVLWHPTML